MTQYNDGIVRQNMQLFIKSLPKYSYILAPSQEYPDIEAVYANNIHLDYIETLVLNAIRSSQLDENGIFIVVYNTFSNGKFVPGHCYFYNKNNIKENS